MIWKMDINQTEKTTALTELVSSSNMKSKTIIHKDVTLKNK